MQIKQWLPSVVLYDLLVVKPDVFSPVFMFVPRKISPETQKFVQFLNFTQTRINL